MEIGDHLVTIRLGYTHHGLYIGGGEVIHYSGLADDLSSGRVEVIGLESFSGDQLTTVIPHPFAVYGITERIERARSRLGEDSYNVLTNNCEHFVNWCIDGTDHSSQVKQGVALLASPLAQVSPAGSLLGPTAALAAAAHAASTSDKPVQAAAASLTKSAAAGATMGVAAVVVGGAALPLTVAVGAVYGIRKLWKMFD